MVPKTGSTFDRTVLFVGDAMGHGVPAALVMSTIKAGLGTAMVKDQPQPHDILSRLNTMMLSLFEDQFVTAACCLLDRAQRRLTFSAAGHAGPLWYHARDGRVTQVPNVGALPLGINAQVQYTSNDVSFAAGDTLVLSTDGIVEQVGRQRQQYGLARLQRQVARHGAGTAGELIAKIEQDFNRHREGCVTDDDLTLLVVKENACR